MTTKEYLEQVTIGKLSELSGRILLKEYNPAWATRYEEERRKISQALGQDGVAIEHVGSTSVPGLCAKPILDILLLVKDASVEGSYVPALVEAGYTLRVREPDWFGHRMLKGTSPKSTCTYSHRVAPKHNGCSISGTGYAHTKTTATCMRTPKEISHSKHGGMCRIMPMPNPMWFVPYSGTYRPPTPSAR